MEQELSSNIRIQIEAEIIKTKQSIVDYKDMSRPEGLDDAVGRVSRMDAINNKSITQAALREAEEKLSKLKYVLSKLGETDFGLCARCKNKIPIGRILLRPQSIYCVQCAK